MVCVKQRAGQTILMLLAILSFLGLVSACTRSSETVTPQLTTEEASSVEPPFQIAPLEINPVEVSPGMEVIITIQVTNTGGTDDNYRAVLKINDTVETERTIYVPAGKMESAHFSVFKDIPGTYDITLGDMAGQFLVVKQVDPTQPSNSETAKAKFTKAPNFTGVDVVTNKSVSFDQLKGSTVLLNFVNYGCSSRLNDIVSAQLLVIRDLSKQRKDFIPVSIFCGCCSPDNLREFAIQNSLTWTWILDIDNSIIRQYTDYLTEYGYPTLVFINKDQYITDVTGYCDFFTLDAKLDKTR